MKLLRWQVRWEQVAFWRNPQGSVFTFVFPLMFLVVLGALNRNDHVSAAGGISEATYLVPSILVLGVMNACYSQLAMVVTERRESGAFKRLRATPLPASSLVGGLVGNSLVIACALAGLTLLIGRLLYDAAPRSWAPVLACVLLATLTMCPLGIAVSTMVKDVEAGTAVVQLPYYALAFISGVFGPAPTSGVLRDVANCFPQIHLVHLALAGFDPRPEHWHALLSDVTVAAGWAVVATVIAVRRFRWEPRR